MRRILLSVMVLLLLLPAIRVIAQDEDPVFMRVRRVLVESLGVEESRVTLDASLVSLGMNNSNKDNVKRDLEVQFGIIIPRDEFERMPKVGDVVTFFRKKLEQ